MARCSSLDFSLLDASLKPSGREKEEQGHCVLHTQDVLGAEQTLGAVLPRGGRAEDAAAARAGPQPQEALQREPGERWLGRGCGREAGREDPASAFCPSCDKVQAELMKEQRQVHLRGHIGVPWATGSQRQVAAQLAVARSLSSTWHVLSGHAAGMSARNSSGTPGCQATADGPAVSRPSEPPFATGEPVTRGHPLTCSHSQQGPVCLPNCQPEFSEHVQVWCCLLFAGCFSSSVLPPAAGAPLAPTPSSLQELGDGGGEGRTLGGEQGRGRRGGKRRGSRGKEQEGEGEWRGTGAREEGKGRKSGGGGGGVVPGPFPEPSHRPPPHAPLPTPRRSLLRLRALLGFSEPRRTWGKLRTWPGEAADGCRVHGGGLLRAALLWRLQPHLFVLVPSLYPCSGLNCVPLKDVASTPLTRGWGRFENCLSRQIKSWTGREAQRGGRHVRRGRSAALSREAGGGKEAVGASGSSPPPDSQRKLLWFLSQRREIWHERDTRSSPAFASYWLRVQLLTSQEGAVQASESGRWGRDDWRGLSPRLPEALLPEDA
ncbi:uncharacterized protein [Dasypus novemcinctus]|uniref:uncharacterized protein n=1 Tax=Dasypus novemcinctus TaxID=9361 RepID=UPI0039C9809A